MEIDYTKRNPKDTYYSVVPINWLLRKICLSYINRKGDQLEESDSIIKIVIYVTGFAIFNIYSFYEKIIAMAIKSPGEVFMFVNFFRITYWFQYFEYIIDIFICYKHRAQLLTYFKTFDDCDAVIGIPYFERIRKILISNLAFGIFITIFVCVFCYIAWAFVLGIHFPIIETVDHIYFFFNTLTIIDLISHVIQVEYRLRTIRESLQVRNT